MLSCFLSCKPRESCRERRERRLPQRVACQDELVSSTPLSSDLPLCLAPLSNAVLSFNTDREFHAILAASPELGFRLADAWKSASLRNGNG